MEHCSKGHTRKYTAGKGHTRRYLLLLSGPGGPEPALGSCCTAVSVGSSTARHGVLCADIASMQQIGPRREYGLACQCAIMSQHSITLHGLIYLYDWIHSGCFRARMTSSCGIQE